MPQTRVVGISGNIHASVQDTRIRGRISSTGCGRCRGVGADLRYRRTSGRRAPARRLDELATGSAICRCQMLAADILVVGSPTFKGSYTGLFKHVFDLLDPSSLRGSPSSSPPPGAGNATR